MGLQIFFLAMKYDLKFFVFISVNLFDSSSDNMTHFNYVFELLVSVFKNRFLWDNGVQTIFETTNNFIVEYFSDCSSDNQTLFECASRLINQKIKKLFITDRMRFTWDSSLTGIFERILEFFYDLLDYRLHVSHVSHL
jgi:hypothetical protein